MVDFAEMPPVDVGRRKEAAKRVTKLQNGAKFEFGGIADYKDGGWFIKGRYLDYTGEWCVGTWDSRGRVQDRKFAEMDLAWSTARNA